MIEQFFNKLSLRLRKENHLSDITWAIAEVCPIFQKLFLRFFFDDITHSSKVTEFKREHSADDCRPDFYINVDGRVYIIECKIHDGSHHFEQYRNRFPDAKIGYIANYKLPYKEGFQIKSWKELKTFLSNEICQEYIDIKSKELITSYLVYLAKVCSIYEIKEVMNLHSLSSLSRFNGLVKMTISSLDQYNTNIFNQGKSCDHNRSGQYFSVSKKDGNITIWPWLGVYYADETVVMYIEFNQKWCWKIYEAFPALSLSIGGNYYKTPYKNDDYGPAICYELKKECFDQFNNLNTVEAQAKLVKEFTSEVFKQIDLYIQT